MQEEIANRERQVLDIDIDDISSVSKSQTSTERPLKSGAHLLIMHKLAGILIVLCALAVP